MQLLVGKEVREGHLGQSLGFTVKSLGQRWQPEVEGSRMSYWPAVVHVSGFHLCADQVFATFLFSFVLTFVSRLKSFPKRLILLERVKIFKDQPGFSPHFLNLKSRLSILRSSNRERFQS